MKSHDMPPCILDAGGVALSISEIEEACPGVSRGMVRVVLRAMKAEGLITPTGKGRAAKWEQLPQAIGQATPAQPDTSAKKP